MEKDRSHCHRRLGVKAEKLTRKEYSLREELGSLFKRRELQKTTYFPDGSADYAGP